MKRLVNYSDMKDLALEVAELDAKLDMLCDKVNNIQRIGSYHIGNDEYVPLSAVVKSILDILGVEYVLKSYDDNRKYVKVLIDEFSKFISEYPNKLERDCCMLNDPAMDTYNDFSDGRIWPESVVAKVMLYSKKYHEKDVEYFIKKEGVNNDRKKADSSR